MTALLARRRFGGLRTALGLARASTLIAPWLLLHPHRLPAQRVQMRFYRQVMSAFGVRASTAGTPPPPGSLVVANHVSWLDILLLGSTIPLRFVSKHEVGGWPLVGRLARRAGTILIDRSDRRGAGDQAAMLRGLLSGGHSLALFPEGTTGDGRQLLPFRTSLFAAADGARAVVPVAIVYGDASGRPLGPDQLSAIAWTETNPLAATVARIAGTRLTATAHSLPPLDPALYADRKQLADACRAAISSSLMRLRGFS